MTVATKNSSRNRSILEQGLAPKLGQRTTRRLLEHMEDCVEKRTNDLATRSDLRTALLQVRAEIKEDMFVLEQKLTSQMTALRETMHANTWKILLGVGSIMGIVKAIDVIYK